MKNNVAISPEEMERVVKAMGRLSSRTLPKVRIGEPNDNDPSDQHGAKVDWFSVDRFANEVEGCSLSPHTERKLFEQGLHVQAAKRQLVVVRKIIPRDRITSDEARLIASVRNSHAVKTNKSQRWNLEPQAYWPHPEVWVHDDTVLLLDLPPDDNFPLDTTHFYRFIASGKLGPEHMPYVEEYLFQAEVGPFAEYTIPATKETEFVANVLRDIARL